MSNDNTFDVAWETYDKSKNDGKCISNNYKLTESINSNSQCDNCIDD